MSDFDKFKSCKDCPDRCVSPNCHTTCDGYLYRVKKQEDIKAKRRQVKDFDGYQYDKADNINKAIRHNMKNKKKYR